MQASFAPCALDYHRSMTDHSSVSGFLSFLFFFFFLGNISGSNCVQQLFYEQSNSHRLIGRREICLTFERFIIYNKYRKLNVINRWSKLIAQFLFFLFIDIT